jgi:hypothetical protein
MHGTQELSSVNFSVQSRDLELPRLSCSARARKVERKAQSCRAPRQSRSAPPSFSQSHAAGAPLARWGYRCPYLIVVDPPRSRCLRDVIVLSSPGTCTTWTLSPPSFVALAFATISLSPHGSPSPSSLTSPQLRFYQLLTQTTQRQLRRGMVKEVS